MCIYIYIYVYIYIHIYIYVYIPTDVCMFVDLCTYVIIDL